MCSLWQHNVRNRFHHWPATISTFRSFILLYDAARKGLLKKGFYKHTLAQLLNTSIVKPDGLEIQHHSDHITECKLSSFPISFPLFEKAILSELIYEFLINLWITAALSMCCSLFFSSCFLLTWQFTCRLRTEMCCIRATDRRDVGKERSNRDMGEGKGL